MRLLREDARLPGLRKRELHAVCRDFELAEKSDFEVGNGGWLGTHGGDRPEDSANARDVRRCNSVWCRLAPCAS